MLNLHRAAVENQKIELKAHTLGFSVAVMNGLDMAINGGKGNVLKNWLEAMDAPAGKREKSSPRRSSLSPSAISFFAGLPRRGKE